MATPAVLSRAHLLVPVLFGVWLLFTSLSDPIASFGGYDAKRVLELALMALTALLALVHRPLREQVGALLRALPGWAMPAFGLFLLLGLASAARFAHPAYSLVEVAMYFLLVMSGLCVAAACRLDPGAFERLALAAIAALGLGIFAQEALAVFVYLSTGQQYNYRESLIYFLHPRMYNHLQTWTLPLLPLLPLAFGSSARLRALCVALIGFQWFIILATGARGSTVSLVAAMCLMALLLPRARAAWLKPQLLGALAGLLLYGGAAALLDATVPGQSRFVDESVGRPMLHTSGRLDLWQHALEGAAAHPLLGTGPARYACEVEHYLAASPHNFYLQILGEWGLPATAALAALLLLLANGWWRRRRARDAGPAPQAARFACLSTACAAALIHLGASGLLIAPAGQVAGMLVAGWMAGQALGASRASKANTNVPTVRARLAGPLLLAALLVASSVLTFGLREQAHMATRAAYAQDYGPITPRFWQHGKICRYAWE